MKFYRLADRPTPVDAETLGVPFRSIMSLLVGGSFCGNVAIRGSQGKLRVQAISAGEKRCPKAGEWFLSGAIASAYRAENDLSSEYHIARLVVTQTREITEIASAPLDTAE